MGIMYCSATNCSDGGDSPEAEKVKLNLERRLSPFLGLLRIHGQLKVVALRKTVHENKTSATAGTGTDNRLKGSNLRLEN